MGLQCGYTCLPPDPDSHDARPSSQVPEGFVKLCTPLSNSRYHHMMRFSAPEEEEDESEEEGDDDDEDDEGEGDGHEHKHDHHGHDHDHSGCCGHKHHVSACCLELNLLHWIY